MHTLNDGISLRVLEKKDLEWARLLHNEPSTLCMLTNNEPVSQVQQHMWFKKLCISPTSSRWVITCKAPAGDVPVGVVRIDNKDYKNSSVQIGLDIASAHRRQGIATKVYKYLLTFFFDKLEMNRISLKVLETNLGAKRIYEKLGFIQEGIERQAIYRDGKFIDYILMSVLRDEYEKNRNRYSTIA